MVASRRGRRSSPIAYFMVAKLGCSRRTLYVEHWGFSELRSSSSTADVGIGRFPRVAEGRGAGLERHTPFTTC